MHAEQRRQDAGHEALCAPVALSFGRDRLAVFDRFRDGRRPMQGGYRIDVIGPPTDAEGGLFSEINDNSVAILLTYGTARHPARQRRRSVGGAHGEQHLHEAVSEN